VRVRFRHRHDDTATTPAVESRQVDPEATAMSHESCPRCGESGTVEGRLSRDDTYGLYFLPKGVPWWWGFAPRRWIVSANKPFFPTAHACLACGCFWGELPPSALRDVVNRVAARTKKPAAAVKSKANDPDFA
jgi:hypothetical protein